MELPARAGALGRHPRTPTFQQLTTVSCGSPVSCVAVGFYQGGSASVQAGLVDTLSNGQWTPIRAPLAL